MYLFICQAAHPSPLADQASRDFDYLKRVDLPGAILLHPKKFATPPKLHQKKYFFKFSSLLHPNIYLKIKIFLLLLCLLKNLTIG